MTDFPRSLLEFQRRFPDEAACAGDQGPQPRVRRLPQADLSDGQHRDARLQAAAHRLVLGGLPYGLALQRHLGPARLPAANFAPGATARTDGWASYPGAPDTNHDPRVVSAMAAHIVLPWVHRVFSNLKTWGVRRLPRPATPSICKPTSTSSCSASTAAERDTPPSAPK